MSSFVSVVFLDSYYFFKDIVDVSGLSTFLKAKHTCLRFVLVYIIIYIVNRTQRNERKTVKG